MDTVAALADLSSKCAVGHFRQKLLERSNFAREPGLDRGPAGGAEFARQWLDFGITEAA